MFEALKRLIVTVLKIGLLDFLRRVGWKWALGTIVTVVAVGILVVGMVVALLVVFL